MKFSHILYVNEKFEIIDVDSLPELSPIPSNAILYETSDEESFYPEPNEANWVIYTSRDTFFVPRYLYNESLHTIEKRSQVEIDEDLSHAPPPPPAPPSQLDKIEAQITYTAIMTDTLIEEEE